MLLKDLNLRKIVFSISLLSILVISFFVLINNVFGENCADCVPSFCSECIGGEFETFYAVCPDGYIIDEDGNIEFCTPSNPYERCSGTLKPVACPGVPAPDPDNPPPPPEPVPELMLYVQKAGTGTGTVTSSFS